ncbi:type II toxin-antitoxin system HipA family toxin [Helicobacter jaachi]|uniref:Type II toxin-antitoxin system HipA family toxin n=1 Tax=Helicobacter jaachi TaxID=1677920 RepID=A0A4U8T798_9HELI|nr:type II toxin-antitoxin system HipA family toxin [Helicobacter jaachi]TLD95384.1 type II toxin-antitoxin system HipA family toxin [Helicobacter jaachi]
MAYQHIEVYDEAHLVGELVIHSETYFTFQYTKDWNKRNALAFAIDSQLPLENTTQDTLYTNNNLWGCFADLLPDRWGRKLQSRHMGRALSDIDYMLGVSDYYRIGSLRLKLNDEFIAKESNIPQLIHINEIMQSSLNLEKEEYSDRDLAYLLGCGSSLGGARPKACLADKDKLYIAKFPSVNDEYSVILWEKTMLDIAKIAHIEVPNTKLIDTKFNRQALLVERFDRTNGTHQRIPFQSAMSLLNVSERAGADQKCYIDVADKLSTPDKQRFFRRMVFNTLFGNTDDHLRNHALLYDRESKQWNLAPAYDLNPNPIDYDRQYHALKFTPNTDKPSLSLCKDIMEHFAVDIHLFSEIVSDCIKAGEQYKKIAAQNGIKSAEIKFMAGNFEHKDIEYAKSILHNSHLASLKPKTTHKPKLRTKR